MERRRGMLPLANQFLNLVDNDEGGSQNGGGAGHDDEARRDPLWHLKNLIP